MEREIRFHPWAIAECRLSTVFAGPCLFLEPSGCYPVQS
jgi:hypothetical protein